jgi:hypothetical protein
MWTQIDLMYAVPAVVIGIETLALLSLVQRVSRLRRHEEMVQRRAIASQFLT